MTEIELAQKFIEYLSCYDLYFEVDYGRCIDIVGISNNKSIAVEVKKSFNFKVLEQAISNKPLFNYSFIAVPSFKDSYFQELLCKDYGVGLLIYNERAYREDNIIVQTVIPKLNRSANIEKLLGRLHDYNKKSLAGSKSGDSTKITAFGVTVSKLKEYVQRHEGCLFKDVMKNISHHYRTDELAKSNLYQWIRNGVIKDLYIEKKRIYSKVENLKEVF
jgi:hypothetical protein